MSSDQQDQQDSPAPPIPAGQPDPVLVGPGMKTLGEDAYTGATKVTPDTLDADKKHPVDIDAPSYFQQIPGAGTEPTSPTSPSEAAKDAKSPKEILRRLSLVGSSFPNLPDPDPRQVYPGLNLTGRIISAAFCIPYKVRFHMDSDWVWYFSRISFFFFFFFCIQTKSYSFR